MRGAVAFAFLLLLSGCVIRIPVFPEPGPLREVTVFGEGEKKIVLINVKGVLSWERMQRRGFFGYSEGSIVSRLREELDKARADDDVVGLVIKVSSPGGLVSVAETMWREIAKFKEEKKVPVVAYIVDVGASGGYYIVCHADWIVANPGSVVGSIGVIVLKINAQGLLQKIGVELEVAKGGEHKDMLFFHRGMTEEERRHLESMVSFWWEKFKERVREGRGDKLKVDIDKIADGRIFTPEQALEFGLVDEVGGIEKAFEKTAELAGVKSWRVVAYTRKRYLPNVWADTYERDSDGLVRMLRGLGEGIVILYLWSGAI